MTDTELGYMQMSVAFAQKICENLEADGVKIYPYNEVYSYVQADTVRQQNAFSPNPVSTVAL